MVFTGERIQILGPTYIGSSGRHGGETEAGLAAGRKHTEIGGQDRRALPAKDIRVSHAGILGSRKRCAGRGESETKNTRNGVKCTYHQPLGQKL